MKRLALTLLCALAACRDDRPAVRPDPPRRAPDVTIVMIRDGSAVDAAFDVAVAALPPAPTLAPVPDPAPLRGGREEPFDDFGDDRAMSSVPLPAVPAALAADVRRYRALVLRSMRCWADGGRVSHTPDAQCPTWYAQLSAGGPAAMHAIGTFLVDDGDRTLLAAEREATRTRARNWDGAPASGEGNSFNTASRLAPVLAGFASTDVVAYVLAGMRTPLRRGYGDWGRGEAVRTWLAVLPTVTENDLTPLPPWQERDLDETATMRFLADAHDTWARWYRAHAREPLAAWRAAGLARSRQALTERDVARRVAAILRLGAARAAPDDRAAARASLAELLAQRRMSNAGRRSMRAWATGRGWSLDEADGGVSATAGSPGA